MRFAYEWHDDSSNWFRSYGNENWEFDEHGLMRRRVASINDQPISETERKFRWPLGPPARRPSRADRTGAVMTRPLATRSQIVPVLAEVFRERGFEGASLAAISKATGLGKGSLYHFFPAGKEEMANAVFDEIGVWFEREVFAPLASGAPDSIQAMFDAAQAYFRSGRRVCLIGAFALDQSRNLFAGKISAYFVRWVDALALALSEIGYGRKKARARSEEIVSGVQGAIVLARALDDPGQFERAIERLRKRARPVEA